MKRNIYAVSFNNKLSSEAYATFEEAKAFLTERVENTGCRNEWETPSLVRYTNTSGLMIEGKIEYLTFEDK